MNGHGTHCASRGTIWTALCATALTSATLHADPIAALSAAVDSGVGESACPTIVCVVDPYCCETVWDDPCGKVAAALCHDFVLLAFGECPPSDHDCFTTGGPGCTDSDCCLAVCYVDPFCCGVLWDSVCVNGAIELCPKCTIDCPRGAKIEGEACGDTINDGCNTPIVGPSDCCTPNPIPGCDDADCVAVVCAEDSFCCEVVWDFLCADRAISNCADICFLGDDVFEPIACGETICGTAWAFGGFRDQDWFEFTVTEPTLITFTGTANFPLVIGRVSTGGIADCAIAQTTYLNPSATASSCETASFTTCLEPGTHWLFVAINAFDGLPCGSNNDYVVTLTCSGDCVAPACGDADGGDCFRDSDSPYCDDLACCLVVCKIDPLCCVVQWDSECSTIAGGTCQRKSKPDLAVAGWPWATDDGGLGVTIGNAGPTELVADVLMRRAIAGSFFRAADVLETQQQTTAVPAADSVTIRFSVPTGTWCFSFQIDGGVPEARCWRTVAPIVAEGGRPASLSETWTFGTDYPLGVEAVDIVPTVIGASWDLTGFPTLIDFSGEITIDWTLTAPAGALAGTFAILFVDIRDSATGARLGEAITKVVVGDAQGNPALQQVETAIDGMVTSAGPIELVLRNGSGTTLGTTSATFAAGDDAERVRDLLLTFLPLPIEPDRTEPIPSHVLEPGASTAAIRVTHHSAQPPLRLFVGAGGPLEELVAGAPVTVRGVTFTVAFDCPSDLDGNGVVDGADLGALLNAWGSCPNCPADLNGDGVVDGADLGALLNAWGSCP